MPVKYKNPGRIAFGRNLWIEDVKQDETRKRRIAKSVEDLRQAAK
jgi:uncharacterized protein YdeI (YjbR/CyaY-like superfamily)